MKREFDWEKHRAKCEQAAAALPRRTEEDAQLGADEPVIAAHPRNNPRRPFTHEEDAIRLCILNTQADAFVAFGTALADAIADIDGRVAAMTASISDLNAESAAGLRHGTRLDCLAALCLPDQAPVASFVAAWDETETSIGSAIVYKHQPDALKPLPGLGIQWTGVSAGGGIQAMENVRAVFVRMRDELVACRGRIEKFRNAIAGDLAPPPVFLCLNIK
jgi:hypothetical protein